MHDLLVVHVLERLAALTGVLHRRSSPSPGCPSRASTLVQIGALDELHHEVLAALVGEVVEDLDDPRMAEQRE